MTDEQTSKGTEFLIAEYQETFQEFRRIREEGVNRLNFLITLTSATVAGLILLTQLGSMSATMLQLIAIGVLCFLILVAWDTFKFSISRDVDTDMNIRVMARIRRFFINDNPSLKSHLTWQDHDEPTSWIVKNTSNIRRTTKTILALLGGLVVGLLFNLSFRQLPITITTGIITFVIGWFGLNIYANRQFKKARESAMSDVRFPNHTNNNEQLAPSQNDKQNEEETNDEESE